MCCSIARGEWRGGEGSEMRRGDEWKRDEVRSKWLAGSARLARR
jgi:hypothetical protein